MSGKAIFAQLRGNGAVADLVATRVYPVGSAPTNPAIPYVEYDTTGADFPRSYTGSSGLADAEIDIACVAGSYADAVALATAVRKALDNQSGTWGGIVVQGAFVTGNPESAVPIGDAGPDLGQRYEADLSVRLWYEL